MSNISKSFHKELEKRLDLPSTEKYGKGHSDKMGHVVIV